jgi:two-component system, OmpR family, sensor histidine kinase CreC
MRLPGLHSIHWKVFVFHLAVLFLPVAYLAWQVRLNLESTQLRATEEGMIDTAAVVGELYARLASQTGNDPAKLRENFTAMFSDFENNRSTKARLFGFTKDDADTRLIFYDAKGAVIYDTWNLETAGRDDSNLLEVRQAMQGRYGSRWELDPKSNRVNLYSTLPVWSGAQVVGAVTIVKPTVRSRLAIIRALRELAIPGLAAVTIATLLAYVLSAYLTRIVGGLAARAERVAAGEADVKLETWTRSELGTLARAVEKMRRKLEGKAYVEEMVTNLSHELKTPLAAIRGSAELLEDGAVNDPVAREKFLGNIQLEASRLNQIVDDLLKLSRVETAPPAGVVPPLDLGGTLRRLAEKVLQPRAERLGVRFSWSGPDQPLACRITPEHFEQVVGNLADNAFQFTPDGRAVSVRLSPDAIPGHAVLEVCDEGKGIESSMQPRIFDRFFTTENPRTGLRGTGLGLALVRSIVRANRGTIAVASAMDRGTIFTVRLPVA